MKAGEMEAWKGAMGGGTAAAGPPSPAARCSAACRSLNSRSYLLRTSAEENRSVRSASASPEGPGPPRFPLRRTPTQGKPAAAVWHARSGDHGPAAASVQNMRAHCRDRRPPVT